MVTSFRGLVGGTVAAEHPPAFDPWPLNQATARLWKPTVVGPFSSGNTSTYDKWLALQRVVDLGYQRGERTPWAKTVRTCQQLLQLADGLWTFLEIEGVGPTNNAAERGLRPSVIQRRISHGVQSTAAPSAAAACSPSPCGNKAVMSGSFWSRPGSPITAAG